jgi:ABC-type multidrug transport system fused ATPase/permease subunit
VSDPDARGPARFLWWLVRRQLGRVGLGSLYGTLWMVALTLPPYVLSRAIDLGLQRRDLAALIAWAGLLFAVGLLNALLGIMRHRTMTKIRLDAALRTVRAVIGHATRLGATLPSRVTAGEVVTIGIGDVWIVARSLTVTGPGVGAVIAYAVVAVLLFRISPLLAVVVLAGVPVLAVVVGPLLGRLQKAGAVYRERQGALTGRLVDIVGGLRILNGLGGKDAHAERYRRDSGALRDEGYRVGAVTSWVQALSSGLPAIFLAVVTWLAARLTAGGDITVGELVAVYGYAAVLAMPVFFLIEGGSEVTRGLVAARRITDFLRLAPGDEAPAAAAPPPGPARLHDPVSGVFAEPGLFTAVASARTADAAAVIDRLGRYGPTTATWGGLRVDALAKPAVRERILVADNDADLFAGPLREVVAGRGEHDDDAIRRAIDAAVAHDVAGDLGAVVEPHGRNLSGGQRQRVRLARALLADPEMLLAVDPTSAVDAHTETAIADRLTGLRRGRGTLVATTSPVLLDRADVVHYLVDGAVAASGAHRDLLTAEPGYHALVFRQFGEDPVREAPRGGES